MKKAESDFAVPLRDVTEVAEVVSRVSFLDRLSPL